MTPRLPQNSRVRANRPLGQDRVCDAVPAASSASVRQSGADRKFKGPLAHSQLRRTGLMSGLSRPPPTRNPPVGRPGRQPKAIVPLNPLPGRFTGQAPSAPLLQTQSRRACDGSRCARIFAITCGSSMLAMTWSFPPQRAQSSISMPNTRFSRRAQLIATCRGVGGLATSAVGSDCGSCIAQDTPTSAGAAESDVAEKHM